MLNHRLFRIRIYHTVEKAHEVIESINRFFMRVAGALAQDQIATFLIHLHLLHFTKTRLRFPTAPTLHNRPCSNINFKRSTTISFVAVQPSYSHAL